MDELNCLRLFQGEQHFSHRQCLIAIQAKNLALIGAHFLSPKVVAFLRTEEVHNISAAACPVVAVLQINMQNPQGSRRQLADFPILDLHVDRLPALTALGIDGHILLKGKRRAHGIDGTHGKKLPPIRQGHLVIGGQRRNWVQKIYAAVFISNHRIFLCQFV